MKSRLTPYYVELIFEACLKSFWRKRSLAKFLRQCKISEVFLGSWTQEESKRELLDRLFPKLLKDDNGRVALVKMAKFLMEQQSFPDLANWEDSEQKIQEASVAVKRLKIFHDEQEKEIESDENRTAAKRAFRQKQKEVSYSQQTLQKLSDRLNDFGKDLGSQKAGYDFQNWFYDLVEFSEIPKRKPYVHNGRQIDGSLTLSGTTYLVELKFTAEQASVSDIDSFYKKVTKKADNTMGVIFSISGYSSVAIQEASGDKTPLLLFDHSHIYLVLSGIMGLGEVIERVRRHASQTGEAYLSTNDFSG